MERTGPAPRLRRVAPWVVVAPLLAVVVTRLVAWNSHALLVELNALTPILFLPAWPLAVAAVVSRRRALLGATTTIVAAHLMFTMPEVLASTPLPSLPAGGPRLRLFNANVFAYNGDVGGYAEEIRRSRPDVVILQEATPAFFEKLQRTGSVDELPHRVVVPRSDPFGMVVASRWALTDDEILSLHGRPIMVAATLDTGEWRLRLFAVHVVSPAGHREEWEEGLDAVAQAVALERQPAIVAGDLNSGWGNPPFRRLLDVGLTDAAAARGRPFQMTWTPRRGLVPPLARIDHVLTTEGLVVTSIRTGTGRGSDHRPLVADIAIR